MHVTMDNFLVSCKTYTVLDFFTLKEITKLIKNVSIHALSVAQISTNNIHS